MYKRSYQTLAVTDWHESLDNLYRIGSDIESHRTKKKPKKNLDYSLIYKLTVVFHGAQIQALEELYELFEIQYDSFQFLLDLWKI